MPVLGSRLRPKRLTQSKRKIETKKKKKSWFNLRHAHKQRHRRFCCLAFCFFIKGGAKGHSTHCLSHHPLCTDMLLFCCSSVARIALLFYFSMNAGVKLTDVEKQFIAEEYDVLLGTFKDYGTVSLHSSPLRSHTYRNINIAEAAVVRIAAILHDLDFKCCLFRFSILTFFLFGR